MKHCLINLSHENWKRTFSASKPYLFRVKLVTTWRNGKAKIFSSPDLRHVWLHISDKYHVNFKYCLRYDYGSCLHLYPYVYQNDFKRFFLKFWLINDGNINKQSFFVKLLIPQNSGHIFLTVHKQLLYYVNSLPCIMYMLLVTYSYN